MGVRRVIKNFCGVTDHQRRRPRLLPAVIKFSLTGGQTLLSAVASERLITFAYDRPPRCQRVCC